MNTMGGESTAVRRSWLLAAIGGLLVLTGCADPAGSPAGSPAAEPVATARAAVETCSAGQSDCGGACQATGAACTVGVGACANTGTVVCGAGAPDLAARGSAACALGAGGTVQCWGSNTYGALGDGTTVTRTAPVSVRGLRNATAVAVGSGHACALLADATVRCWGRNAQGQLGDGTTTQRLAPVAVVGLAGATALVAHGEFTCARLTDGTARCWGYNASGQLGDGTVTRRLTPVPVAGLAGVTSLAAGTSHACAVLGDGTAQCWGLNSNGQLGDGTLVTRGAPAPVAGLTGATAVIAGAAFTCALRGDGTARCWGQNSNGQLGDGSTTRRPLPVTVAGLTGATQLAAGASHACATLGDGTARCWGANANGQLGDGTVTQRVTATPTAALAGAVKLVAGDRSTCALQVGGAAQCWGDNTSGQLGDGTNTPRTTPLAVVGLDAGTTCSVAAGAPSVEVCDGADNDCNGVVDDVAPTACIPGACATRGHRACGAGPGFATLCVVDALRAAGTVCRAAVAGGCDVAESCDGVGAECPTDVVQAAGTVCRGAGGVCDVAEVCTGVSNACPVDALSPAGSECRPAAAGGCDVAEACTGAAKACPTDRFLPSTTVCRGAAGPCDRAETCRGNSSACPADALQPSTVVCRAAVAGGCDVAELCTGGAATCPDDVVRLAGTVCRTAVAGGCDVAEVCDGVSNVCPANVVRPAGTSCRGVGGVCDVAELCDGASASCPADAVRASGVVCRPAVAGGCDVAESCNGSAKSCPSDARRPAGTICHEATGPCDLVEVCSGTSTACPVDRLAPRTTICRTAVAPCAVGATCSGTSPTCPNATLRDGVACDDGNPCTTTDRCSASACVGADPMNCDDGNPCTADACGVPCVHTAIPGCGSPGAGILPPPNPPVDTAAATQESAGVALIDPAGVVPSGSFSAAGFGPPPGELPGFATGWEFSPAGPLASPVSVRLPVRGPAGTLYAVVGLVGGVWQVESVARVTTDGTHTVAQLARLGQHALVRMPGCDSTTGAFSTGLEVGDPQEWAPQSPIVASESGGTWAWLTQGVYVHVGSADLFVEEGPRSADEDSVRMSGNGVWLAYVRNGIRRYDVSTLHPGDDSLEFTTVAMPEGPEGPWQYEALALSWDGRRMVFIAQEPVSLRSDIFQWESSTGIRPLTSDDGRGGSLAINGSVREIALSANGRWLSFVTDATDVVPSFASPGGVYLRDLQTGETTLVAPRGSVRSSGASISRSGRFVAWRVPIVDDEENDHLWVWDRATDVRAEVSRDADGTMWPSAQWSMSNDGTRFIFGALDGATVEMKVRARWLRAASSSPLYTAGVSPVFGDVTGVFPVITGSGGFVFAGEYGGTATPSARVVRRYLFPNEAIPGSARAVAGDRWEYEPMRVEWGGFSPFNARVAFVWEPVTGYSTQVPVSGDVGSAEVAPRLPLGRHPVITVQNFNGGDGVGVCRTWEDFQVSRARVSMPPVPQSFTYSVSSGGRYLTNVNPLAREPDGSVSAGRYDRRDGVTLRERIDGLTFGPNARVETSALNPWGRRLYSRVYDHTSTTETYADYLIDLTRRSAITSHLETYTYNPSLRDYRRLARLSFNGSVVYPYYDFTYEEDGLRLTGHAVYALEGADATEQFLRPDRYLGASGRSLAPGGAVPVGDGSRALFLEHAETPDLLLGTNHYELREWERATGNDPVLLSWPARPAEFSATSCVGFLRQPVQVATTSGYQITFCADTPLGYADAPVAACRGVDGARWLYDRELNVLRQLSTRCADPSNSPPVFLLNETVLIYVDPREDGLSNLVVYDVRRHVARVAVDGISDIHDLRVNLGGTHASFQSNDRAYAARNGLTWPYSDMSTASVVFLVPLQDEYLGEVVAEAP
jgi:alpha-tubulin suppressor-like RCC1 family protein